ncbi:phage portal protein [Fulvimarina sp. 2208YS6-2-32]|uniref:Phage portal protein n=1 Tax=Fulvimarina uroteuthidis TaxID=3098149 RepID=A0ABU5HY73_9HYPH|nr:phage portal protein [Fulvimarina sp. 2208YS6-2-32]MDY8107755.1 phage portal protein [Fulvimarina sp. 2208YS6-2-32]
MSVPAVSAAVSLISSSLGTLPAKVYERGGDAKTIATDHPGHRLVHRKANEWSAAGALRSQMTQDALLTGNAYAIVSRMDDGRPSELFRVDPSAMAVEADAFGAPAYKLTTTGGVRRYGFRDVLHLRALTSFDGLKGEAPISLAREAIATLAVMEQHGSQLFRDGARPSAAVTYPTEAARPMPGQDNSTARTNLVKAARAGIQGVDNSGKLAVFFDGATFTPFAFSSTDAQFAELRRFAIEEVARVFRVPPHMLFEMGRATWGNAEEMGATFVRYTLLPWIEAWQDAYSRALLDPDTDDAFSIEFLVDDLLRADTATRFSAYSQAIAARILNPNEVRAMENRAPYEGGDEFLNPNTTSNANG